MDDATTAHATSTIQKIGKRKTRGYQNVFAAARTTTTAGKLSHIDTFMATTWAGVSTYMRAANIWAMTPETTMVQKVALLILTVTIRSCGAAAQRSRAHRRGPARREV
jgi:hypothetical protein